MGGKIRLKHKKLILTIQEPLYFIINSESKDHRFLTAKINTDYIFLCRCRIRVHK